jgi:hypothetical protein
MSELGWVLLWSAVPITLVAAVALVMERVASGRGPVAGSWVSAASLLVIVGLTPLAVCGVPERWFWKIRELTSRAEMRPGGVARKIPVLSSAPAEVLDSDEARGRLWSSIWWDSLRDGAAREVSSIHERTRLFQAAWGTFVASGTVWCLLRLLFGVWGVCDGRRRSTLIDDPDVLAEVESMRFALSIANRVEVRELSSLLGSAAAAAGWLRPFILLPRNWRSWSCLERRAVLAHEMAHIGRADYASGIVAQIGLVVQFYHPLVRWLVARLRLQQELAADAVGARLAGGRGHYLKALSRLALRRNENALAWPARAFLPAGGHLIRRIQMLKENAQGRDRAMSRMAKIITMSLLVGVGACAVALRGVAPADGAETPPGVAVATDLNRQRFDVSYLPPDVMGVYAVRPAAILQLPGLKSHFEMINAAIVKEFPFGLPKLESIEQATIEFKLLPRDPSKKRPGRIMTGDWTVRTVKDFYWKTPITMLVKAGKTPGKLDEVQYENRTYYKAGGSAILGPGTCFFYFPDARTVVCSFHEEHLRRRIKQGSSDHPDFLGGDDWQQVDRGLVAVAINNRQGKLKLDLASDDPVDLPLAPLLQQASRWVIGLDGADVVKFRAIGTCAGDKEGEALARIAHERMAMARAALDGPIQTGRPEKRQEVDALFRTTKVLLRAYRLRQKGKVIDMSSEGRVEPDALAAFFQELTPF